MGYLFAGLLKELLVFWMPECSGACFVQYLLVIASACPGGLQQGAKLLCKDKRKTRSFCVEFSALFDP